MMIQINDLDDGFKGILSRIGQASFTKEERNQLFIISCIYATEFKDLKKLWKLNELQQAEQDEISILKKEIQQLKKTFSTELAKVKKERDNALQNNKKRLDDLFVDTKKITTTSSSSASNKRKKPVIHRMKSTHSSSLLKKKNLNCSHSNTMDDLLDLLRKEYLLAQQDTNKVKRLRLNPFFF